MIVTEEIINSDFNKLKKSARNALEKNDLKFAALCMQKAATLMYNSNPIYADVELEEDLHILEKKIFTDKINFIKKSDKKRIVFYDYFVLDNRGLTEQYLNSFFESEYEVLFIGCYKGEKSTEIYRKLKKYNFRTEIIIEKNIIKKTKRIEKTIEEFKPEIILAHTAPFDVAGLVAIVHFQGKCKRYLSNITDHAFWLGTTIFDFFIEFRNYGYNISKKYRGISENKLLLLPYYPIINREINFDGFNFDTTGKKLIFSGGSIYKIQGSPVFLEIVKYILENHSDTIFLFLGNGDFSYLENFVKENSFQGRFFYSKERKDIYEVFKHCTLYLNTYPMLGGLMTQYACIAGKLPVTLNTNGLHHCNNVDELLLGKTDISIQYKSKEDCERIIDYYLNNPNELESISRKIKSEIISADEFRKYLFGFFEGKNDSPIEKKYYDIDVKEWADGYLKRFNENKCISYYKQFTCKSIKIGIIFFKYFIKSIFL